MNATFITFLLMVFSIYGFTMNNEPASSKVGAAKVDMTPSVDALPTGYSKINDNLYCRAIVIENGTSCAVLVSVNPRHLLFIS